MRNFQQIKSEWNIKRTEQQKNNDKKKKYKYSSLVHVYSGICLCISPDMITAFFSLEPTLEQLIIIFGSKCRDEFYFKHARRSCVFADVARMYTKHEVASWLSVSSAHTDTYVHTIGINELNNFDQTYGIT